MPCRDLNSRFEEIAGMMLPVDDRMRSRAIDRIADHQD
jgi:hypothetical protein